MNCEIKSLSGWELHLPVELSRPEIEHVLDELAKMENSGLGAVFGAVLLKMYEEQQHTLRAQLEAGDGYNSAMTTGALRVLEALLQDGFGLRKPLIQAIKKMGGKE